MIDGEPRVIEREGRAVVVDQSGAELVCRRSTRHPSGGSSRKYHRIDVEAFETGTIQPACNRITHNSGFTWVLRRKENLDALWGGCSYAKCYGDYNPEVDLRKTSTDYRILAARLEKMSVAEFDAITKRGDRQ